jgi:hypothetical protein
MKGMTFNQKSNSEFILSDNKSKHNIKGRFEILRYEAKE